MKKSLLIIAAALALFAGWHLADAANTIQTSEVDGTTTILTGANTITLAQRCTHVVVFTTVGASPVEFTLNHGATAAATNCTMPAAPGGINALGPMPPTDQINYYCVTGAPTGSISYMAWGP
jgi:hypothetical protein